MDSTGNTITTALGTLTDVASSVMDIIQDNALLMTLWVSSLMFIGIRIVMSIKRAAKR